MRLFLHSGGRFAEAEAELKAFLGPIQRFLFVPWAAAADFDTYVERVRGLCGTWGFELDSIHDAADPVAAVEAADALFMGGGNTFCLVERLHDAGVIEPIRARVAAGMPYLGSSAGSNVACPTMCTTNDMPIQYPRTFETLDLVPFQINPHYLDPDPESTFQGETREKRIEEFLALNDLPVIGLREGSLLRREGHTLELRGTIGARLFQRGAEPVEHKPGDRLDQLLSPVA